MTINNEENVIVSVSEVAVASFGSRFMAITIDFVLLFFFISLLLVATGTNIVKLSNAVLSFSSTIQLVSEWLVWVMAGLFFSCMCYFCFMHACCGQTIGKKIMGIRLESSRDSGLNLGIFFLRWVGYIASAIPFFFGFLWALLDVEGRTWHDRLAGTRVVYG